MTASVPIDPDHYVELAKDGTTASRLTRTFTSRDLGLVTERVWSETLNDIVDPEQMAAAREEFSRINVALLRAALREGLGAAYGYEPFVAWVGATSSAFFATLSDAGLETRAVGDPDAWDDAAMKPVTARVAERHGVPWMADDDLDARAREVIAGQVRALVARRDGQRLEPAVADLITAAVVNIGDDGLVSFESNGAARFQAGRDKEAVEHYGGADALEKRTKVLYERMFGLTPFDGERRYRFSLTLPGAIVETNGTLDTDARVRWSFQLREAFAFGYTMRCRSLEPNAASQRAAFGAVRLDSREAMLRYVSLVDGDGGLLEAVRQAIAEKRAAPIPNYRASLGAENQKTDKAARAAKLMALLGMKVK